MHLQHCHVFKTSTPEQAEDLNTLIGNAFRLAYANQIHHEERPISALGYCNKGQNFGLSQSRSADSLLSPDTINEDLGIIADLEPVYETPDFEQRTFRRPARPRNDDLFSIKLAPMQQPEPPKLPKSAKFKPNTLPVLNCLFAALGKKEEILDETPYAEFVVPDLFSQMNNNKSRLGNSFTQECLNNPQIYNNFHSQRNLINKSKSAHVITSCEVYAEVADHQQTMQANHLARNQR